MKFFFENKLSNNGICNKIRFRIMINTFMLY